MVLPMLKIYGLAAILLLLTPAAVAQNADKVPFQTVQEPSNLPYVGPIAPPGAKLVYALKSKAAKNGRMTLILRYASADTGANVVRYYAGLLPRLQWTVSSANEKQLSASFKSYNLSASVYAPSRPGANNDIQLIYQMPVDE